MIEGSRRPKWYGSDPQHWIFASTICVCVRPACCRGCVRWGWTLWTSTFGPPTRGPAPQITGLLFWPFLLLPTANRIRTYSTFMWTDNESEEKSVVHPDPHHFLKLDRDPHLDSHQSKKAESGSASGSASKLKAGYGSAKPYRDILERWSVQIWDKVSGGIRIRIRMKVRIRNPDSH